MSLIKLNNRAVKDVTQFGSISSLGSLVHISTATASASASIEFTLGNYKEYQFYWVNCHPQNDNVEFKFQTSTDNGSTYETTITSTIFFGRHHEDDTVATLEYEPSNDQAQGTGFQTISFSVGGDADESCAGILSLFNPSSTTYVKHFTARSSLYHRANRAIDQFTAGYFNTTSALTNIKFQFSSGNIDAGQILLFGVN